MERSLREHTRHCYCVCEFQSVKKHGLDSDLDDTKRRTSSTFDSGLRLATIFASHRCGMDRHSWILLRSQSFHQQQQRTYENINPVEVCPPDMCTVRSLVKELELLQKPIVDGVFLVIVTQTYATLNDLLLHHKQLKYTPFCLLRQFSNVKSLLEISSQRLCRVMRMSLIDQRVNCMQVFNLEAFRSLMERGSRKVP